MTKKYIQADGVLLPDWLFNFNSSKKGDTPSTAEIIVEAAVLDKGRAFQASTSPSQASIKKTIIIDKNSFSKYRGKDQIIALIKRLKLAGFDIRICAGKDFAVVNDNLDGIVQLLDNLGEFQGRYKDLGIAIDKAELMSLDKMSEIIECFSSDSYEYLNCQGNDWQYQERLFEIDEEKHQFAKYYSFDDLKLIIDKGIRDNSIRQFGSLGSSIQYILVITNRIDALEYLIEQWCDHHKKITDDSAIISLGKHNCFDYVAPLLIEKATANDNGDKSNILCKLIKAELNHHSQENIAKLKECIINHSNPKVRQSFLLNLIGLLPDCWNELSDLFPQAFFGVSLIRILSRTISKISPEAAQAILSKINLELFQTQDFILIAQALNKKGYVEVARNFLSENLGGFGLLLLIIEIPRGKTELTRGIAIEALKLFGELISQLADEGEISEADLILFNSENFYQFFDAFLNLSGDCEECLELLSFLKGKSDEEYQPIFRLLELQNPKQILEEALEIFVQTSAITVETLRLYFKVLSSKGVLMDILVNNSDLIKEVVESCDRFDFESLTKDLPRSANLEILSIIKTMPQKLIENKWDFNDDLSNLYFDFYISKIVEQKIGLSFKSNEYPTISSPDDLKNKHITHFYIANLSTHSQLEDVIKAIKKLPDLASIQIVAGNVNVIKDFFSHNDLQSHFSGKIKFVSLPINLLAQEDELLKACEQGEIAPEMLGDDLIKQILEQKEIGFEFVDYQKYFEDFGISPPEVQKPRTNLDQNHSSQSVIQQNSNQSNKIFIAIADDDLNPNFVSADDDDIFAMVEAGEVLKGNAQKVRVRNGIMDFQYNPQTRGFNQKYVNPVLKKIDPPYLSDNARSEFASRKDGATYCQFSQQLWAGKTYRLCSISANNEFAGMFGNDSIEIQQGDDGIFYATAKDDCIINYVIKSSPVQKYKRMSNRNPIRKIIDDYKDKAKGYLDNANPDQTVPDIKDFADKNQWLEALYNQRAGVCIHRVLAVWHKLKTSGIPSENFRVVSIDNNHVILEVKDSNGDWLQADLGGGSLQLDYSSQAGKKYSGSALEKESDEISQENQSAEMQTYGALKKESDEISQENQSAEMQTYLPNLEWQMLGNLQKVLEPEEKICDVNSLLAKTVDSKQRKILLTTKNKISLDQHSNFLIRQTNQSGRPVFYIDHPSKIDIGVDKVLIDKNGQPVIKKTGLLEEFLQIKDGKEPLIIVNWDNFDDKQKLALNTLLDRTRSVSGIKIADQFQIISLSSQQISDSSFLSRHNLYAASDVSGLETAAADFDSKAEILEIDLQGLTNWRRALFGKIILQDGQMFWQKSQFVLALESGQPQFQINNISPEQITELKYQFEQAKAQGYLLHQGYKIKLPENFVANFGNAASFNFADFANENIFVATNQKFPLGSENEADLHLINAHIFDQLLYGKEIKDGQYVVLPGLLEQNQGKTLKLFISSKEISSAQWYCLFYQAQEKNIKLELYLADGVVLPEGLQYQKLNGLPKQDKPTKNQPQIFITNSPKLIDITAQNQQEIITIDVEDYNYRDLFGMINYEIQGNKFVNFEQTPSLVLDELQKGNKVVLRGEFSQEFLWEIEQIITKKPAISGIENLVIIIEKKVSELSTTLSWLPKNAYQIKEFADVQQNKPKIYREDFHYESSLTANSKDDADQFIAGRKNAFIEMLEDEPMLQLIGSSGVGKSALMKAFETERQDNQFRIYREMSNLANWASPCLAGQVKILFIDEANIEDKHLTMFEPLKKGGNHKIVYNGQVYQLSANHKLVFASNPKEYGGGRVDQKLFADGLVPQMRMLDFPLCYIYEQILKNGVYKSLSQNVKSVISETEFKEQCQKLIEQYQKANRHKDSRNYLTVRELQEQALIWLANEYDQKLDQTKSRIELKTPNFISTEATASSENALRDFLNIRTKQKSGLFDPIGSGLNGVLLEGASGIGKSEMIAAMLDNQGLKPLNFEDQSTNDGYYKIDANITLSQKRAIIIKAFEEGKVVWIDEINGCIEDGLEKILNSVLTDEHPDKAGFKPKSGFMLIASANYIDMAGRANLSPAIRHRMMQPQMKELKEYKEKDLQKIILNWLNNDEKFQNVVAESSEQEKDLIAKKIADDFQKILANPQNKNFNLRMLRENALEKMLEDYKGLVPANKSEATEAKELFGKSNSHEIG